MSAPYLIRAITSDELPAATAVFGHAFHSTPPSERDQELLLGRVEFDRTLAAFDRGVMVATAGAYSFGMRVPGALVPVAGVTFVAVLPSHRRRGILTEFMRGQLADIHGRGEAVAALWASEAGIYGRFGYGCAAWLASYRLRRGEGRLAPWAPADAGLRLRLTDPATARAELSHVHDLELATRPGFWARSSAWWDSLLEDAPEDRDGATPLRCVLAEDDTAPRGYALYRGKQRWDDRTGLPDSTLHVVEAIAADPAATAALWGDLLSRDLTGEVTAHKRPVDDPLLPMLADPRRVRRAVVDALWVRLVDVGAALAQRRYACPVDVVIDVTDPVCRHNNGRWHLSAGASGALTGCAATCERTTAPADVVVAAQALGAAYLGGTRLGTMARAGLATEVTPGSVAVLSAALSWRPGPWCPVVF